MDEHFEASEKLYRVVLPKNTFWKDNGSLSSAAFKDKEGLSVDRQWNRTDAEAVGFFRKRNFVGEIVYVFVQNCNEVKAVVKYLPSKTNVFHSEIHRDRQQAELSSSQAKRLAKCARVVKITTT